MISTSNGYIRTFTDSELEQKMDDTTLRQALEYLRTRGSARDDYHTLITLLPKLADELVALIPGLHWEYAPNSNEWSGGNFTLSGGYFTTNFIAPSIIIPTAWPGDTWGKALAIVKKYAEQFGTVTEDHGVEVSGPDVYYRTPNDTYFNIGYETTTSLTVSTGVRLRQDIYDGHTSIDEAIDGYSPDGIISPYPEDIAAPTKTPPPTSASHSASKHIPPPDDDSPSEAKFYF